MTDTPPVVFLSYSHDSDAHRERVLRLSERLRSDGFETRLDRYVQGTPEEGWPRWMLDRLDEVAFVLVVCTETYYRRFRGHEQPGQGHGVDWEGALITQEMYDARSRTRKFVPVLFDPLDAGFIPEPLRSHTQHTLDSEPAYAELCNFLAGVSGIEPGPVDSRADRTRPQGKPLTFPETGPTRPQQTSATSSRASTSRRPELGLSELPDYPPEVFEMLEWIDAHPDATLNDVPRRLRDYGWDFVKRDNLCDGTGTMWNLPSLSAMGRDLLRRYRGTQCQAKDSTCRSSTTQPDESTLLSPAASPALQMWQQKLGYLLTEEAKASDAAAKFKIKQDIVEARQKIDELERDA